MKNEEPLPEDWGAVDSDLWPELPAKVERDIRNVAGGDAMLAALREAAPKKTMAAGQGALFDFAPDAFG